MSQYKEKFVALLEELFQLNQPELDFGLYRILHARSRQIKAFVQNELSAEIDKVFAGQYQTSVQDQLHAARLKIEQTLGDYALEANGDIKPEYAKTKIGQEYETIRQQAQQGGGLLADDAQIYDHLYRFFSRYYDKGDFMSRRYFVAENDSRALPYAIPYDGREVMLHWANKDQYYIKSSEYLANFTVDLAAAQKIAGQGGQAGFDFAAPAESLTAHFRLAAASEGEHNNVKEGQERYFLIHSPEPVKLETNAQGQTELVIQFQYRPDPEKTGQAGTWQQKRLNEAETAIQAALTKLPEAETHRTALATPAPTDKQPNRTLLGKYLGQYTSRNTMDYFIHKNLGGFLRRELDFYIKNEIMRLDDIENAEAPRVEAYLKKLQSLRKIARRIIDFLAQIEDFQKKLWLKKKFVVETNYCITLDRIPEALYPEIATNDAQREEWVRLFAIDEIVEDTTTPGYSVPLSVAFLKSNQGLSLDTQLFPEDFTSQLVAAISDVAEKTDGVLLYSDNFQALNLLSAPMEQGISTVYIDPPYNTDASPIDYKNGYRSSSWLAMMTDRLELTHKLMGNKAVLAAAIDDAQQTELRHLMNQAFENNLGTVVVRSNPSGRPTQAGFSVSHEYVLFSGAVTSSIGRMKPTEEQSRRFSCSDEKGAFEWRNLRREGSNSDRSARRALYYPIYINGDEIRVPEMSWDAKSENWIEIEPPRASEIVVLPDNEAGDQKTWRWEGRTVMASLDQLGVRKDRSGKDYIYYKRRPNEDGVVTVTSWFDAKYSATEHGTAVLKDMFGKSPFSYPKSVHAVMDSIYIAGASKPHAIVLDYFGGSGTTAHAVINLNKIDRGCRKYILAEMGLHFDAVLKPRIQKAIYSNEWKDGKPVSRDGISHCFKYLRLESYEDTLNNLLLPQNPAVDVENPKNSDLARDYLLKYWLDFETAGSPSLLNVRQFADPTAYRLKVKQPGSEAQVEKTVDLIETFNWLIGLHVAQLDRPRRYAAELVQTVDPDLPKDQDTRWTCARIDEQDGGEFWFRWVEGHVLAVPGDETSRQRVLVLWRKLISDAGRDQAVLEAYLAKKKLNPLESEFETIYINGSHALPSDGNAATRVRLIEETFAQRMWEDA